MTFLEDGMPQSIDAEPRHVHLGRRAFLRAAGAGLATTSLLLSPLGRRALAVDDLPAPLIRAGGDWRLTFQDTFDDAATFRRNWRRVRNGGSQHRTMRLPENVVVADGSLQLELGHQADQERPFTGGYVRSRTFRQCYGYFECDMRIADEPGVNNAFWLIADPKTRGDVRFELDVVEAKYPNIVQVNARRWRPERITLAATHRSAEPLAQDFHRYAMLWTEKRFTFFFDDKEIFSAENTFAHTPAILLFSNAVAPFAGKTDGDVRGAATAVDRIRVFSDVPA